MTDSTRERLAAALAEYFGYPPNSVLTWTWFPGAADALLPVVQALVAEGQAEALEAAAEELRDHAAKATVKASDLIGFPFIFEREVGRAAGYGAAASVVLELAVALRATTSGEGATNADPS